MPDEWRQVVFWGVKAELAGAVPRIIIYMPPSPYYAPVRVFSVLGPLRALFYTHGEEGELRAADCFTKNSSRAGRSAHV
jgi:hypothetical protein